MISRITADDVQQYIFDHEHEDERKLALSKKEILGVSPAVLAEQIRGRRKAKEKLPSYYRTRGIVYPPGINLEQCSSEQTAQFKASIIQKHIGKEPASCADLTGGFGVDSFAFSKICNTVHTVDSNESLLEVAKHNHALLGATNIKYHNKTAEDFLLQNENKFDFIFIDPSRRGRGNQRVFKFSECEPNVVALLAQLLKKSDVVLVKASPLIDITQGLQELPHTQHVYVVSVNNECKEVLFLCVASFKNEPDIHAINITDTAIQDFSFKRHEEKNAETLFSEPLLYLYEPNSSILKAGAFKIICLRFGVAKLHVNTHLYTSNELRFDFPGRIFRVKETIKASQKDAKPFFPGRQANIITRNYPLNAESLKKKMKLKDGGEIYLFAFKSLKGNEVVVAGRIK